jgi:hypothetical protein
MKPSAKRYKGTLGRKEAFLTNLSPTSFKENQAGNYIYSKKNSEGKWVPIYIGQGDLKDRTENHHQAACIARKGATHIHVRLNPKKEERLEEEQDLLSNYTNAYVTNGCNEKGGG